MKWQSGRILPAADFQPFADADESCSIIALFERQVRRTPYKAAIIDQGVVISYAELNQRANAVAHLLQERVAVKNARICVVMEHGPDKIIAAIGILKAALVVVPLDIALPDQGIDDLITHCRSSLVITDHHQKPRLNRILSGEDSLVKLPLDYQTYCDTNPDQNITPSTPVRIGYTSGSTGSPKGVLQSNGQNIQLVKSLINTLKIGSTDRVIYLHNFYFDILIAPLICGGTIYPFDIRKHSFYKLFHCIDQHQITAYFGIATGFRQFLSGLDRDIKLPSMRAIGLIGEPLYISDVLVHHRVFSSSCSLINFYGTTEHGHISSFVVGQPGSALHNELVPAGYPPEGVCVVVVNDDRQPVARGVLGEVVTYGKNINSIYFDNSGLTAITWMHEPAVTHPDATLNPDDEQRIYFTGDLAYIDETDCLHIVGRKDDALKIRGYRVLPSEIENSLLLHESVDQVAIVQMQSNIPGEQKLVCYFVSKDEVPPSQSVLRNFLSQRLPAYMIPSLFLAVDDMPLTGSGKIARQAFPKPKQYIQKHMNTPPRSNRLFYERSPSSFNAVEESIQRYWQSLLGVKSIARTDEFLSLGGDSISALRLATWVKSEYNVEIQYAKFLGSCTISSLSVSIERMQANSILPEQSVVAGPTPLTPAQLRFLIERDTRYPHHWNVSVTMQASKLEPDSLAKALQAILGHHETLRLRLTEKDGVWKQDVTDLSEDLPFSSYDLSHLKHEERIVFIESKCASYQDTLDLTNGPIMRLVYFACGAEELDRLFLTVHHFAVDGFSWPIVLEDFESAYLQILAGDEISFPAKTTSFQVWAKQLRQLVQKPRVSDTVQKWLDLPWDRIIALPSDSDFPAGLNTNESIDVVTIDLDVVTTKSLVHSTSGLQAEQILISALASCLSDWTKSDVVLIDLLHHGRDAVLETTNLSRTVGFMLSYNPLVLTVPYGDSALKTVQIVGEQLHEIPEGFSFDLIRYFIADNEIRHTFNRLPKAQVLFNYLGANTINYDNSIFTPACESPGPSSAPKEFRQHPLAVHASINGDNMRIKLVFSRNLNKRSTIENLAYQFESSLMSIREFI